MCNRVTKDLKARENVPMTGAFLSTMGLVSHKVLSGFTGEDLDDAQMADRLRFSLQSSGEGRLVQEWGPLGWRHRERRKNPDPGSWPTCFRHCRPQLPGLCIRGRSALSFLADPNPPISHNARRQFSVAGGCGVTRDLLLCGGSSTGSRAILYQSQESIPRASPTSSSSPQAPLYYGHPGPCWRPACGPSSLVGRRPLGAAAAVLMPKASMDEHG